MSDTILLYLPVALHRQDGELYLEDQACNGLRLWAEHFDRVLVLQPLSSAPPPPNWVPLDRIGPARARVDFITLPECWRPLPFLMALPRCLPVIRGAIARADRLGFAIGGLVGDWGSIAAWCAHRMGKPFYVWTDRVESEVVRRTAARQPWRRRLRAHLEHRPMAWAERALIRRAALGLFHGRETFEAYAPHCRNPHLVHDIHLARADHVSEDALQTKLDSVGEGPLRIVYVGRADAMKGAQDWLDVLEALARKGVTFHAQWLGTGPALEAMRARVAGGPLAGMVELPGHVQARATVLEALRTAHMMLFCHKTPESPRCLIEALASACPIVGYGCAFSRDLIAGHGGGALVARDDMGALAARVAELASDRAALVDLIARARHDGAGFHDEAVFAHRAALIREHLPLAREVSVAR